ncbi:MAG: AsmA family protein [Salinivirgaceae bacterium]
MKKLLKIVMYFFVILFALIVLLIVVAKLSEKKIAKLAVEKAGQVVNAPITINDVSFNLLRKFPFATIELNDVCLGAYQYPNPDDSSQTTIDTLACIGKLYVSVKTRPLIKGEIDIIKVELLNTYAKYTVDSMGATNFDFLMDTTAVAEEPETDTTPSTPLNITLKELTLKNIVLNYDDASLKAKAQVGIPRLKMSARALGDAYSATVEGNIVLNNSAFDGTNLHLMKEAELRFDVDYRNDLATISQLQFVTDGLEFELNGTALVRDTITTDLAFNAKKIDLAELIKYAPAEMLEEFGVKKVAGVISFDGTAKGNYIDSLLPQVSVNLYMNDGAVRTTEYPELKNLSFAGSLTNGLLATNKTTSVQFKNIHVETGSSSVDLAFTLVDIDHPAYEVSTKLKINVADFASFIPDSLLKSINGVVLADLKTRGQLPDSITDAFTDYALMNSSASVQFQNFNVVMDSSLSVKNFGGQMIYTPGRFQVKNLHVSVPEYKVNLKNTGLDTYFKGSVNRLDKLAVDVKRFHLETDSSSVSVAAYLKNLDHPSYRFNGKIMLNLAEVFTMMPDTLLNHLSGGVTFNMKSAGTLNLDSIETQAPALAFENSSFALGFSNINVELPDELTRVNNFSGQVTLSDDTLRVNKLGGSAVGIDFLVDSTQVWNLYKAFIQERRDVELIVQTKLHLGTIDYAALLPFMGEEAVPEPEPEPKTISGKMNVSAAALAQLRDSLATADSLKLLAAQEVEPADSSTGLIPDFQAMGLPHMLIRGSLSVDKVIYEKNILENISALFRISDSLYVIDQFKFITCGGLINTSVMLDARNWAEPKADIKNVIEKLDVNKLLVVNDNFVAYTGDTLITSDNLSGILTSEFHARAFMVGDTFPTNRIRAKGHFTLENGKVYDYPPLVELSESMKAFGGLRELAQMDFNTLKTSLFMLNDKIYIPQTDVVSNALDLSASAMQSMGEDYEYHITLHLGDVLTGKSKKLMEEQAKQNKKDGGTVERSGINLVSMKVGDEKKNGFDNDKLKEKMKKTITRQNSFLNLLFDPRLVNFSTDLNRVQKEEKTQTGNN